jgi:hypothetical protein
MNKGPWRDASTEHSAKRGRPRLGYTKRHSVYVRLTQAEASFLDHLTEVMGCDRSKVMCKLLHAVNPAVLAE